MPQDCLEAHASLYVTVVMLTCSYFTDRKSVRTVLCMGDVQATMLVSFAFGY